LRVNNGGCIKLKASEGKTCTVIYEKTLHSQNMYKFSAIERMWCCTDFWPNSSEQLLWTTEQDVPEFILLHFNELIT
jgi:hypothetical protein